MDNNNMPETSDIRAITRRVKKKALEIAEEILNNPEKHSKEIYEQTFLTVVKNAVPRTQEITGEDGESIKVEVVKYADHSTTLPVSTTGLPVAPVESV